MAIDELVDVGVSKGPATGEGGAAWGLASIVLGAVATMIAPMILLLNLLLWQSPRGANRFAEFVGIVLLTLGVATMLALSGCGVAFGWTGRRIDRARGQDAPLATAGILLGVAAALGWIMVGIQTILIFN